MLQTYFWRKHVKSPDYKKYYFQQDGATAHTADIVQDWLKSKFSKKFVNKKMWPPRSPDLNPCDFYLWGHLKSVVYNPLPKTLDDLKANIKREIKKFNELCFFEFGKNM
jgi:transposase